MESRRINIYLTLFFSFSYLMISAQSSIVTSGGAATGSGGSVNYSLGQVLYTTNSDANNSISNGVQQPYEIMIVSTSELDKKLKLNLSTYPNPTNDFLKLKVDAPQSFNISTLNYQLFNSEGKLLEAKKITSSETNIPMGSLPPANYIVKINIENKEAKTFKIIKN